MIEGREAANRFRDAMKAILSVPKSAVSAKAKKTAKKKTR